MVDEHLASGRVNANPVLRPALRVQCSAVVRAPGRFGRRALAPALKAQSRAVDQVRVALVLCPKVKVVEWLSVRRILVLASLKFVEFSNENKAVDFESLTPSFYQFFHF